MSSKIISSEIVAVVNSLHNLLQPKPSDTKNGPGDEREIVHPPRKLSKTGRGTGTGSDEDTGSSEESDREATPLDDPGSDEEADGSGWESGSIHSPHDDQAFAGSSSDSDEDNFSDNPSTSIARKGADSKQLLAKKDHSEKSATSSTFLPSLAVGYTRGDSDASDFSDGEAGAADGGPRKNRRGQRARRA